MLCLSGQSSCGTWGTNKTAWQEVSSGPAPGTGREGLDRQMPRQEDERQCITGLRAQIPELTIYPALPFLAVRPQASQLTSLGLGFPN